MAFIPSWVCIKPIRVALFKLFCIEVLISFSKLKRRSTEALENGNVKITSTIFLRLGYLNEPEMVLLSKRFFQNDVDISSRFISSHSSNACCLHSRSVWLLSEMSFKYGSVEYTSYKDGGLHLIALLGNKNSIALKTGPPPTLDHGPKMIVSFGAEIQRNYLKNFPTTIGKKQSG